jgi:hypothetical protein
MTDRAKTDATATAEWVLPPSTAERPVVSEGLAERLVEEGRVAGHALVGPGGPLADAVAAALG